MKLSEFDYQLPTELIATHPVEPRDSAKLLVLDKNSGAIKDAVFSDLTTYLKKGDILVFNNSKVIPARLHARATGRDFEILLVKNVDERVWECWVRPGRKAKLGQNFVLTENLNATLLRRENEIFFFEFNLRGKEFFDEIQKIGEMPIPPYILKARHDSKTETIDTSDYQTIYAKNPGSVAAPTAGLHFTPELMLKLREKGVEIYYVTLHVGLGTFQPVNTENVEDYDIHSEYFEIDAATAEAITKAKAKGNRVIAVGTTSARVLESAAVSIKSCGFLSGCGLKYGLMPKSGETNIYIYPGYDFKIIDGMITNFHLPKSSLLLLVSALSTKENILNAYQYAVEKHYRFYSYGDGMLII